MDSEHDDYEHEHDDFGHDDYGYDDYGYDGGGYDDSDYIFEKADFERRFAREQQYDHLEFEEDHPENKGLNEAALIERLIETAMRENKDAELS